MFQLVDVISKAQLTNVPLKGNVGVLMAMKALNAESALRDTKEKRKVVHVFLRHALQAGQKGQENAIG